MNEDLLTILLIGLVVLLVLVLKSIKPKIKGKYGEAKIKLNLKRLNSSKYKVINDILIRHKTRSSQIDHIIISNYGIFVIETKHYKGWIFGHESSNYWTQTLYKNKYKFRNPVLQSWGHVNTLKSALSAFPRVPFYPIVVFTGSAKLKKITSEVPVIKSNRLIRCIKKYSRTEFLSSEMVDEIYQIFVSLNSEDKVSRRSHIRKAKTNTRKGVKSNTCPRCGGRLVLKSGKYGMFYGCSNFPNCNYTKANKK